MSKFNDIYETMLGLREPEAQVPWVRNAFEEGDYCAREYEEMRAAYQRICERTGLGDEDQDLEVIVTAMENIQKELCGQAFDLGQQYVRDRHYFD